MRPFSRILRRSEETTPKEIPEISNSDSKKITLKDGTVVDLSNAKTQEIKVKR